MKRIIQNTYLGVALLFGANLVFAQELKFENQPISTEAGNFQSAIEVAATFVDFDGDHDDDLFFSRYNGEKCAVYLYRNSRAGTYVPVYTPLKGLIRSAIAFGDVDNDGDQDLLATGVQPNSLEGTTKLYLNNGFASFNEKKGTSFLGVDFGAVAFADVDGDKDLDVLITGLDDKFKSRAILYINNNKGNFTESKVKFEGVARGTINFADIDQDGDQDVLITGINGSYVHMATLYRNDGQGNFSVVPNMPFVGVHGSAAAFSDVDQDGDQDVLITGIASDAGLTSILYINDGNGAFKKSVDAHFEGVRAGSISFVDIDHDNDQDVLISGTNKSALSVARLYQNDGTGKFQLVENTPFVGSSYGATGFSDIDGDKDMDVMITGNNEAQGGVFKLYINKTGHQDNNVRIASNISETFGSILYPNPSNGEMTLGIGHGFVGTYEVVDVTGKKVLSGSIENETLVPIHLNHNKGVYFLKLVHENGTSDVVKFIKE